MKKQKIQMIVLLVILGLAIAAYFGFKAYNDKKAEEEEAASTFTAYTVDTSDITRIECESESGSFSLDYDSDADSWSFTDDPSTAVSSSEASTLADDLSEITSDHEVADITEPADYGFDDPMITITVTHADGSQDTLYVGDENTTISEYYFRVGDSTTIYTVDSDFVNDFNVDKSSLVDTSSSSSSSTDEPTEAVSSSS
ncbi:MAG: DUF4340 domain-containing protein [Eubacteriales bacterium]|jgi:hypothetical protein